VIRSVITVITGGSRPARSRARTAGSAVIGWKATMSAGRCASAARATLPYTGAMIVRRTAPSTRGESLARQNIHHSQGVSRMHGP